MMGKPICRCMGGNPFDDFNPKTPSLLGATFVSGMHGNLGKSYFSGERRFIMGAKNSKKNAGGGASGVIIGGDTGSSELCSQAQASPANDKAIKGIAPVVLHKTVVSYPLGLPHISRLIDEQATLLLTVKESTPYARLPSPPGNLHDHDNSLSTRVNA